MTTKIYESIVRAGNDCDGEFTQVKKARAGEFLARTVKLYTHGPKNVSRWEPADDLDLSRVGLD